MANGLFGGGDGTKENPYLVEDVADIEAVKNHLVQAEVFFKQVADIDFENNVFNPIGDYMNGPFQGSYDGGGFKINNITIVPADDGDPCGLFGFTQMAAGSTINNIIMENAMVNGTDYVGGLIGQSGSWVTDCIVSATVNGGDYVGGLIGMQSNQGKIVRCGSKGTVSGNNNVGGLVGSTSAIEEVTDCYSTSDVTGGELGIGGLIGTPSDAAITNCFATGSVTATSTEEDNVGGLLGARNSQTAVVSSYYNSETSGQTDTGKGIPKTTVELAKQSTYEGWDFVNTWKMIKDGIVLLFEPGAPYIDGFPAIATKLFTKIKGQWFRLNPIN